MIPWIETIEPLRRAVAEARGAGKRVGLVPTMGALHEGHIALIARCRAEADLVVVSIFVNPTQFGPSEDFTRYPRTPELDRARCAEGGADLIFAPEAATVYPTGMPSTFVEVPAYGEILEGACRPGHFRGVATVVLKLLEIVRPDLAFFGLKDFQQFLVIQRLVQDLHVPVAIRGVPTVRESDGLALSSRNAYLSPEERKAALVLSSALRRAQEAVAAGERSGDRVRQVLRDTIQSEARARIEYAEVADAGTLAPLDELAASRAAVALLAVRIGKTRLIDNAPLTV